MFSALFLAVMLAFTAKDASSALSTATRFVKENTPRDAGTARGKIAAHWILDAMSSKGYDIRQDAFRAQTPKGERSFTNLVCEFRGDPDAPWTVLVSHYDTKPGTGCPGANDGASTTALLMTVADILGAAGRLPGNVMLIWTDAEECMNAFYSEGDGFQGSRHAVEALRRRRLNVRAVICADMLGDRDLAITIPANGSPALTRIALMAAEKAGLPAGTVVAGALHVKDDHVAFLDGGFKAVALIDFEYGSAPGLNDYWHTPADTPERISAESLEKSGRLLVGMLNILL